MIDLQPPWDAFSKVVAAAIAEDLPAGDPTGAAVGPRPVRAAMVARQAGCLAGLVAVPMVLDRVGALLGTGPCRFDAKVADGERVAPGDICGSLAGPADALLAAERTVLNIIGHLSGVATMTAAAVDAVAGTGAVVRDTRKTVPGLRELQKYAVRCGGGENHRMSLSDAVLVKDNHVAALGGMAAAVAAGSAAAQAAGIPLEVEVDSLEELDAALQGGARLVLVDNMTPDDVAEAVRRARGAGAEVEASGGITLASARKVAVSGAHYLAIGALTHSAPALDIGLDWLS